MVALPVYNTDLIGLQTNTHAFVQSHQAVNWTSHYRWPFMNQIVYSIPLPIPKPVPHLTKDLLSDGIFHA